MGRFLSSYNEELTQQFKTAIQQALLDSSKYNLVESTLSLDIKIIFNQDIRIGWVYKPTPEMVVPMRWLNNNGELKEPVIGMWNDKFLEIH